MPSILSGATATMPGNAWCSGDRSDKTRGCNFREAERARAHADLVAAELVIRKACALFEAERDCGAEANMGKMLAADAAWKAADSCLQTFGGFGFAREYGIERKWRETRLYQTAPISTNMILAYIAQHVLGLPRSY